MKTIAVLAVFSALSFSALAQNKASMLKDAGTLDKAKTEIDENIADRKAGSKAKTWLVRGQVYEAIAVDQTGKYAKLDSNAAIVAYDSYKKALEVEPNGGKSNKDITEALKGQRLYAALMQQGITRYNGKSYDAAYRALTLASEVTPSDTAAPLYAAISAQLSKKNDLAVQQLEKYLTNGGKDPQVLGSMVSMYQEMKQIDKALATLDKALTILPNNRDLTTSRVSLLQNSGRGDEAIAAMKQLLEKNPTDAQNALNLGILYGNNASKFSDDLRKLQDDSKKVERFKKRYTSEKDKLDANVAEAARLQAAIKKSPKNADLKRQLASVQSVIPDLRKSVTDYEAEFKAEEAKGVNVAETQKRIGELTKMQQEQNELAKQYYKQAVNIDPNNFDANFNLGVTLYNEAANILQEINQMDMARYNKEGKEIEGRACGRFKQAQSYFQKAKSIRADDSVNNETLDTVNTQLKKFEENKVVCKD